MPGSLNKQLEEAERKGHAEGRAQGRKEGIADVLAALTAADPLKLSQEWYEEYQDKGLYFFRARLNAAKLEAAKKNQMDVVLSLIKALADAGEHNEHSTALHWAVEQRCTEMVQGLLKAGFDPNEGDFEAITPLECAMDMTNPPIEIVKALLAAGAGRDEECGEELELFLNYSEQGDLVELTRAFLEAGAGIGPYDDGSTPLMSAAENGKAKAAALLIEAGCDVNALKDNGETVLMMAAKGKKAGTLDTIKLLLKSGAEINYKKNNGHTALISAARTGHSEAVRFLISAGADVLYRAQEIPGGYGAPAIKAGNAYDLAEDEAVKEILKSEMHRRIAAVLSVLPPMPVEVRQKILQLCIE